MPQKTPRPDSGNRSRRPTNSAEAVPTKARLFESSRGPIPLAIYSISSKRTMILFSISPLVQGGQVLNQQIDGLASSTKVRAELPDMRTGDVAAFIWRSVQYIRTAKWRAMATFAPRRNFKR